MNALESILVSYNVYVQNYLQDIRSCRHTHPPITMVDNNCLYCKKYGNVFVDKMLDVTDLNSMILPLQNLERT